MQVCTSLQTDNHASTPPLSFLQAGSVIMSGNEVRSRNVFRHSRCGMHAYSARVYMLMCRMSTVTWFRSGIVSVHCHWNELCCAFSTLWWLANSEQSCSRKPSSPSFEYAFRLYQSFFLSVCLCAAYCYSCLSYLLLLTCMVYWHILNCVLFLKPADMIPNDSPCTEYFWHFCKQLIDTHTPV